jgi:hypothetical protein
MTDWGIGQLCNCQRLQQSPASNRPQANRAVKKRFFLPQVWQTHADSHFVQSIFAPPVWQMIPH